MRFAKFLKAAAFALPLALAGKAAQSADVIDVALSSDSHKTLVAAVQAAGLVSTLQGPGPFTVFAPTDEAFAALPPGTVEELLKPENKDKLTAILTYHVVPGKTMAQQIKGKQFYAKTVQGQPVFIEGVSNTKIFVSPNPTNNVTNKAHVLAQVPTGNGVVHVIDKVLLPQ
ncbi:MAG: fasciclin domain-containing protein [Kiloniellales bacterium]|nr:fasciclin domain-containing protein [Kiloniellales bacterium]